MTEPGSSRLQRIVAGLRSGKAGPLVALVLCGIAAVVAIALITGGGSDDDADTPTAEQAEAPAEPEGEDESRFAVIDLSDTSWVPGQPSLLGYDGYVLIATRAENLGRRYQAARDAVVAEQERLAKLDREQAQQAARRRALAAYREALRRARLERERQERRLAEQRQRIKERIEALREKYKVPPGEECQIPEVAAAFDCSTGYPF